MSKECGNREYRKRAKSTSACRECGTRERIIGSGRKTGTEKSRSLYRNISRGIKRRSEEGWGNRKRILLILKMEPIGTSGLGKEQHQRGEAYYQDL